MELLFLCCKVFCARILDVSMGTLRTVVTVKGKSLYASMIGFVEVLIWFLIVKEVLNTDNNSIWIAVAYALGFATGTFIGGVLSKKLISGNLSVQIITDNCDALVTALRNEGYAVTIINVEGKDKEREKFMLFIEIRNRSLSHLEQLVQEIDHDAFMVINETKYVQNGFLNNIVK